MFSWNKVKLPHLVSGVVVLAVLLLVPLVSGSPYLVSMLTLAGLYVIFAASWDLVAGYTGQLNLGQALFIGTGAYSVGLLADTIGPWTAVAVGGIAAVAFAFMVGFPCLRLKGPYLGLTTLVVPLIMERLAYTFRDFSGGEFGLTVTSPLTRIQMYYTVIVFMVLSLIVLVGLTRSRIGRVLLAIREDELSAAAAGNNVVFYKLMVFVISAFLTGIAGGILAFYLRHVGPGVFSMWQSMSVVIMGIVGGMGTIIGPAIGGYLLTVVGELLRSTQELQDIIYSLILIMAVLFFPSGIAGMSKLTKYIKLPRRESNHERFFSSK